MNNWIVEAEALEAGREAALAAALRPWIAEARVRAGRRGQAVLLGLHHALDGAAGGGAGWDPWALLPAAASAGPAGWSAWHDGGDGLTIAALGAVARQVLGPGDERFVAARAFRSQLLEQVMDVPTAPGGRVDGELPLALGGFAFAGGEPGGAWQGWPAGLLTVPAVLLFARGGRAGVVLRRWVDAAVDVEAAATAIAAELLAWEARAEATPPLAAVAGRRLAPAVELEARAAFAARVAAARDAILSGALGKVVLARAVELPCEPGHAVDPVATLAALRQGHPDAVCFAATHGRATFVGASPETLVRVRGTEVETIALAGTAPRGSNAAADQEIGVRLQHSRKDGVEHDAVVRAITGSLAPVCAHLQVDPEPRLRRLSDLQHLETRFVGRALQPGGVLDLVAALHPTPAVGGWPTDAARRWLERCEPLQRGWYGGPVGWVSAAGDGVFMVAIRSGLLTPASAIAYAGAGIVGASDPEAEWQETELKLRPLRRALATVDLAPAATRERARRPKETVPSGGPQESYP